MAYLITGIEISNGLFHCCYIYNSESKKTFKATEDKLNEIKKQGYLFDNCRYANDGDEIPFVPRLGRMKGVVTTFRPTLIVDGVVEHHGETLYFINYDRDSFKTVDYLGNIRTYTEEEFVKRVHEIEICNLSLLNGGLIKSNIIHVGTVRRVELMKVNKSEDRLEEHPAEVDKHTVEEHTAETNDNVSTGLEGDTGESVSSEEEEAPVESVIPAETVESLDEDEDSNPTEVSCPSTIGENESETIVSPSPIEDSEEDVLVKKEDSHSPIGEKESENDTEQTDEINTFSPSDETESNGVYNIKEIEAMASVTHDAESTTQRFIENANKYVESTIPEDNIPIWASGINEAVFSGTDLSIELSVYRMYQYILMTLKAEDKITIPSAMFHQFIYSMQYILDTSNQYNRRIGIGTLKFREDIGRCAVVLAEIDDSSPLVTLQVVSEYGSPHNIKTVIDLFRRNYFKWRADKKNLAI